MSEKQKMEARAAELEAEIEARRTPSEKQADAATGANRQPADDEGDEGVPRRRPPRNASRVQADFATRGSR